MTKRNVTACRYAYVTQLESASPIKPGEKLTPRCFVCLDSFQLKRRGYIEHQHIRCMMRKYGFHVFVTNVTRPAIRLTHTIPSSCCTAAHTPQPTGMTSTFSSG